MNFLRNHKKRTIQQASKVHIYWSHGYECYIDDRTSFFNSIYNKYCGYSVYGVDDVCNIDTKNPPYSYMVSIYDVNTIRETFDYMEFDGKIELTKIKIYL